MFDFGSFACEPGARGITKMMNLLKVRFIKFLRKKNGSTLIWAMIVAVIITLVIAAGLTQVQRQQNSAVTQHVENQAYYSAMSVTQSMINWLSGASSAEPESAQMTLIEWILENQYSLADSQKDTDGYFGIPINNNADFLDALGTITIKTKYDSETGTIYIKTHAEYAGQTASIIGTLSKGEGDPIPEPIDPTGGKVEPPEDTIFIKPPAVTPPTSLDIKSNTTPSPYPLDPNVDKFKDIWIHDGGKAFIPSGKGFITEMIYILPGGSITGTQNGNYPAMNINFFLYASKPGEKQALLNLTGGNQAFPIKDIWIQPPFPKEDGSLGLCAKIVLPLRDTNANKDGQLLMPKGMGVHLPIGFNEGDKIKVPLTNTNYTTYNAALNSIGIYITGNLCNICNRPGMAHYDASTFPFCPEMRIITNQEPEKCPHGITPPEDCEECFPKPCPHGVLPKEACEECFPLPCPHGIIPQADCKECFPPPGPPVVWGAGGTGFTRG